MGPQRPAPRCWRRPGPARGGGESAEFGWHRGAAGRGTQRQRRAG